MIDLDRINLNPDDPNETDVTILKDEPNRFESDLTAFDHFLVGAAMKGASDINISADLRMRVQLHGDQKLATKRRLLITEVQAMLAHLWSANDAMSLVSAGRPLDFSYEKKIDRKRSQRFRVNATGEQRFGTNGVQITLRALPDTTPTLDDVGLEEELRDHLEPASGIIVVAGATGHGKSTTMAAMTRSHLENRDRSRKIIDLQAPIEYTFRDINTDAADVASFISQSEIGVGRNIPTFAEGVRAAMRRAPAVINVGESRDRESMEACIEACLTGHLVNTTTHAGSIAEALRRMAFLFPPEEQEARSFDLMTSLNLIVWQRLVKTADGNGRVALREYLVLDRNVRDRFLSVPPLEWVNVVKQVFSDSCSNPNLVARTMTQSAEKLVQRKIVKVEDVSGILQAGIGFLGQIKL
ncbi:MAG: Flp pilus assembly complex ATPase component TadA [Rhodobacteraceae bacterium]|jgi:defect-in-organelle-trafficking protein DotB|uniref:type IV pilus twitching motility protein PilT n=1 Tax=unclassified Sulfitobacter TaxID=196795 RepID=UPI0023E107D1|nr:MULTISPECIES: ATPase, T2SS/T4P/T4SS family [unclassified Sulfitobacter]MBV1897689.1 Flp pilus assembly complex ATPase component TadA [Paracoccaceae bacterium]MDF3416440.1 Flp pilus assembly complex ATPase component TadA [Sulfitobacter sp. KE5]MDF3423920.1 Flp pilus assembly complex ATPase component TadA [Sulfitobacter sp. KE43]MDF3434986.1 Flp pilus assembly complex ATPase component TadA [Sulfitobacter sp. KE42]MDF3460625.1 Flp pilus assembly complex ATPase component TadA [Sulfitobacter sp.